MQDKTSTATPSAKAVFPSRRPRLTQQQQGQLSHLQVLADQGEFICLASSDKKTKSLSNATTRAVATQRRPTTDGCENTSNNVPRRRQALLQQINRVTEIRQALERQQQYAASFGDDTRQCQLAARQALYEARGDVLALHAITEANANNTHYELTSFDHYARFFRVPTLDSKDSSSAAGRNSRHSENSSPPASVLLHREGEAPPNSHGAVKEARATNPQRQEELARIVLGRKTPPKSSLVAVGDLKTPPSPNTIEKMLPSTKKLSIPAQLTDNTDTTTPMDIDIKETPMDVEMRPKEIDTEGLSKEPFSAESEATTSALNATTEMKSIFKELAYSDNAPLFHANMEEVAGDATDNQAFQEEMPPKGDAALMETDREPESKDREPESSSSSLQNNGSEFVDQTSKANDERSAKNPNTIENIERQLDKYKFISSQRGMAPESNLASSTKGEPEEYPVTVPRDEAVSFSYVASGGRNNAISRNYTLLSKETKDAASVERNENAAADNDNLADDFLRSAAEPSATDSQPTRELQKFDREELSSRQQELTVDADPRDQGVRASLASSNPQMTANHSNSAKEGKAKEADLGSANVSDDSVRQGVFGATQNTIESSEVVDPAIARQVQRALLADDGKKIITVKLLLQGTIFWTEDEAAIKRAKRERTHKKENKASEKIIETGCGAMLVNNNEGTSTMQNQDTINSDALINLEKSSEDNSDEISSEKPAAKVSGPIAGGNVSFGASAQSDKLDNTAAEVAWAKGKRKASSLDDEVESVLNDDSAHGTDATNDSTLAYLWVAEPLPSRHKRVKADST